MFDKYLVTRYEWCAGRAVYEVPFLENDNGLRRPRVPRGNNATFFFSPDNQRVCVVATKRLAMYLGERKYATYLGMAVFHRYGWGFRDWVPDYSYARQMVEVLNRQLEACPSTHLSNELNAWRLLAGISGYSVACSDCRFSEEQPDSDVNTCIRMVNRYSPSLKCSDGRVPGVDIAFACYLWEARCTEK